VGYYLVRFLGYLAAAAAVGWVAGRLFGRLGTFIAAAALAVGVVVLIRSTELSSTEDDPFSVDGVVVVLGLMLIGGCLAAGALGDRQREQHRRGG
jgi:hypothetical protein